jgi:hypothetical protein
MSTTASAASAARRAARSGGMEGLARWGLAARAVIYVLVGVLALMLAFGSSTGETDQRGAMKQLSQHTGGFVVLLIVAIGLAGYALWRFSEAALGVVGEGRKAGPRIKSFVRGLVYTFLAVSAFTILAQGHDKSQAGQQQSYTARLMHHPAGRWVVGIVGAVVIVVGLALIAEGVTRKFEKYFKLGEMKPTARKVTRFLGTVGTTARGAVFGLVGVFIVVAAVQYEPSKARGIDGALRALRDTPAGPVLLVAVAAGLVMFGLYGFCEARWRRT